MKIVYIIMMNLFEICSITILLSKIDTRLFGNKKIYKIMFTGLIVGIVSFLGYFGIAMQEIIIITTSLLLLKLMSEVPVALIAFEYIVAIVYISIIQLFIIFILKVLTVLNETYFVAIASNLMLFIIATFTYYFIPINKVVIIYNRFKKIVTMLLALIVLPLLVYMIAWKIDFSSSNYVPIIIMGIIIWTLIVAIIFKELYEVREKQRATEIYSEYTPIFEDLISDVRSKQHDIKNHLHAIYGIAEKKEDQEILKYLESIIEGYHFREDDMLLNTGNKIVSAILYSKKTKARNNAIDIDFKYDYPLPKYPVEDYEFVDILGNLMDNAIEALAIHSDEQEKNIQVNLIDREKNKVIEVRNTGNPIDLELINKMFQKGYSTKGKNRGFGLYNVNKIVKSHNGNIQISRENGYTCFKIIF